MYAIRSYYAEANCADFINIKLMKSGIVEALDIAAIARSANMGLMISSPFPESRLPVGSSARISFGVITSYSIHYTKLYEIQKFHLLCKCMRNPEKDNN